MLMSSPPVFSNRCCKLARGGVEALHYSASPLDLEPRSQAALVVAKPFGAVSVATCQQNSDYARTARRGCRHVQGIGCCPRNRDPLLSQIGHADRPRSRHLDECSCVNAVQLARSPAQPKSRNTY